MSVLDEGEGVAPEMCEQLFEPFRTSRADGSGLGLPLARRVAIEHGGDCRLSPGESGGTRAVLELAREGLPASEVEAQAPRGGKDG